MDTFSPNKILSDVIHHMKYARYLPEQKRRESFEETVQRSERMYLSLFPHLKKDIEEAFSLVYQYKILPSMRGMQFAGVAMRKNNARQYNCSFTHIDHPDVFKEVMFLLLSGCGVGYSVQLHHVAQLPPIQFPNGTVEHVVGDSIEGWADSIGALMDAYLKGSPLPIFDFSQVRPAGALIVTSGGTSPGPRCLQNALGRIAGVLQSIPIGRKLRSLDCHDILCHMADAVLAGGVRRSSYIALFSPEDKEMLHCKDGDWCSTNPQRGLANNSVVVLRNELTEKEFWGYWEVLANGGSGEPCIFQTNDKDTGVNPCGEVSLRNQCFCNLTEINAATIEGQEDFNLRAQMASRLATLQATWTYFPYLRENWSRTAREDALIGVGMTGVAAGKVLTLNMPQAVKYVLEENERMAKLLGINVAKRTTTVKPSGTGSLVLSYNECVSSGVHGYQNEHYLRRIIVTHTEPIFHYLNEHHSHLLEPSVYRPEQESVITLPLKAPEGAITRDEGPFALLERVKRLNREWVRPGYREGVNHNNVSSTVPVKDHEWEEVGHWWWANREYFNSITFLPFDGGTYKQMPYESCDQETYERLVSKLTPGNGGASGPMELHKVVEERDQTTLRMAVACSGGVCELT